MKIITSGCVTNAVIFMLSVSTINMLSLPMSESRLIIVTHAGNIRVL